MDRLNIITAEKGDAILSTHMFRISVCGCLAARGARPAALLLAFVMLLQADTTLGANPGSVLSEHDFLMDLPVVLTATRLRQPVADAPAAVSIIDREMIEASGARELVDLLRMVPGMIVARHSSYEPIVTYGGLGERFSRRMQVLVDGRSVYQPFSGGVLWTDLGLAIEDITQIEVVRGPNAAAYGPNSLLGIINIITRHPAETRGQHISTRMGTQGVVDLVARQSGGGEDTDYRLTLSTRQDNGFPDQPSDKRLGFADLRLDQRVTPNLTFGTRAGLGHSSKSRGLRAEPATLRRVKTDSGHLHLRLDHDEGKGESWSVQYYYQTYRTMDDHGIDLFGLRIPLNDDIRTNRHDLELESRHQIGGTTRLIWGGGMRHDKVASPTFFGDQSPVTDHLARIFANVEHPLSDQATLNLGAMYEYSDLIGGQFSPRAAINYRPQPHHTLRAIVARATRTPVMTEEIGFHNYPEPGIFNGSPVVLIDAEGGLKPESVEYYELGHHAVFTDLGLTLDTKLFDSRVKDIIDSAVREERNQLGQGIRSFRNRASARYQGVETQLDYQLGQRTRLHGGLTYHLSRGDNREGDDRYAEAVPRYIVTAGLSSRLSEALTLSAHYYHYSTINWIDGDSTDSFDGFLDITAQWAFASGVRLGIAVQDLLPRGFDTRGPSNSDIYQVNRRETRSFATLTMEF